VRADGEAASPRARCLRVDADRAPESPKQDDRHNPGGVIISMVKGADVRQNMMEAIETMVRR
jgi:hypothetical protein